MNEFRTTCRGFTAQGILKILEGDGSHTVNQKNKDPVKIISSKTERAPYAVISTNFLSVTKRWTKTDIVALTSRCGAMVHFAESIDDVKLKSPAGFHIKKRCECCSRKLLSWLHDQYINDPDEGIEARAHLKRPELHDSDLLGRNPPAKKASAFESETDS